MQQAGYFVSNGRGTVEEGRRPAKSHFNFVYDARKFFDGTDWSQRKPDQPFFAQVQIKEPHRTFVKSKQLRPDAPIPSCYPEHPVTRADWANYLASIEVLDQKVGAVLKRLDDEGLTDNTLVIFFGDHGRPHVRGKQWLYDGGLHTPLLIRWPGRVNTGQVDNRLVSLLDLMPTTLAAASIDPPKLPGHNLLDPKWNGHEKLFAARDRCGDAADRIRSVRTRDFKYIRNFHPEIPYLQHSGYKKLSYPVETVMKVLYAEGKWDALFMAKTRPPEELYDLRHDPHELKNLAGQPEHRTTLQELRQSVDEWIKASGDLGQIDEEKTVDLKKVMEEKRVWYERTMKKRGLSARISDRDYLRWWEKELGVQTRTSTTTPPPDYWAIEDATARAALPEFKTLPAATDDELTSALPIDPVPYRTWTRSNGDDASSRYSSLDQINRDNVHRLQPIWTWRSGDGKGNIQCNPILVNGLMITPTVGQAVAAVDLRTGKERWRTQLEARPAFRGLLYWKGDDTHPPRVLFNAGAKLYAVTPDTGREIFVADCPESRVAGAVFKHVLVISGYQKDVFGFDVRTGQRLWTFHTLPTREDPEAFATWDRVEEGANCWGGMSLDPRRGIAYVGTGSCKPNFIGAGHRGRNLYANCLLAIDAITGKRLWHHQEIRHDIWDLDIPCAPNLVTVIRNGRRIDAVAQVTKLGHTYLLDRLTGKPLFPIRFRRAPTSLLPGEQTWPYQPALEHPPPFVRQAMSMEDVTDRSPAARASVLEKLKGASMGWFEPPVVDRWLAMLPGTHGGAEWTGACFDPTSGWLYVSANELASLVKLSRTDAAPVDESKLPPTPGRKVYEQFCLACHGTNRTGLGTAPSLHGVMKRMDGPAIRTLLKTGRGTMPPSPPLTETQQRDLLAYLGNRDRDYPVPLERPERPQYRYHGFPKLYDAEGYPGIKPPWGTLTALDLNRGTMVWQVPLGEFESLKKQGVPKTGTHNFGGPLVTAGGLVFCSGTKDQMIRAFDTATGEELWAHRLQFGGSAPPACGEMDGRQLIILPATGGGKTGMPSGDTFIAFGLP